MSNTPSSEPEATPSRTGYVAIVGRPNTGKSTLLNALVGERLSIVTAKPQTTWQRVTGIRTSGQHQMIFLDAPGLLKPGDLFQRSMLGAALEALSEADVALLVLDASRRFEDAEAAALEAVFKNVSVPSFAVINKCDQASREQCVLLSEWASATLGATAFLVSALREEGLEPLVGAVGEALPEAPFLYPPDDLASQPVRFFVAELIRETVMDQYHEEIPYSVVCKVEDFREAEDPAYVAVSLYVERESQKGIVVGRGGAAIKKLGATARGKIEHFLGRSVYLDLWVKVLPGWRRKRHHLSRLGFHVPEGSDAERR